MKTCTKCGFTDEDELFSKKRNMCKSCISIANKANYDADKESYKLRNKSYYELNSSEIKTKTNERYHSDPEKMRVYNKNLYDLDPETHRERSREYQKSHPEKGRQSRNKWKKAVRSGVKGPLALLKSRIGNLIRTVIKQGGFNKQSHTHELLGASYEEVMAHLGPKPEGKYEIDHICPCAQAKTEEELIKLQHYTNLQWLSRKDNRDKWDCWTPTGGKMCSQLLGRVWDHEREGM